MNSRQLEEKFKDPGVASGILVSPRPSIYAGYAEYCYLSLS